ncbi:MAG: hypothetical protein KGO02_04920 [Alphaproteobacteria bacterium]|nr:hypothetical protein [Alphaproteobacteria bacterium]
MHYKTIALELIEQQTELHDRLKKERRLKPVMEICARRLRESHLAWQERLAEIRPQSDPAQRASEALELAIEELICHLPFALETGEATPLSLDAAMASLKRPTSRG